MSAIRWWYVLLTSAIRWWYMLLEVSPVSLVVLAICLALFFIVTHMRVRAKTHARSWWRLASAGHKSLRLVLIFWQNLIGHEDDV